MTIKETERKALRLVRHLLETQGYQVGPGGPGYDLTAKKGDDELHVEVKGASKIVAGAGGFRCMTDGEFRIARADVKWELWVVENLDDGARVTLTRIPRDEVIARSVMEIRWRIRIGAWCRAHCQPVDAETFARATGEVAADAAHVGHGRDTAEGGCAT